jgi:signal transduction histidine kinase/uncharacterized small protein (DUF1192 family)
MIAPLQDGAVEHEFEMTALSQDAVAELKARIAELEQRLQASEAENAKLKDLKREALERQTATAEVLQVISQSAFDLGAVLQTLVEIAAKLCRADAAQIYQRDGEVYRSVAVCGKMNEAYRAIEQATPIRAGPETLVGRVALHARPVQIADAWSDPAYGAREDARIGNVRSMLGVPLIRNGEQIGTFALARDHVECFADSEIDLVRTFADQAVIAIENARLFSETKDALERQTATAEILKVIASSPSDVQPVFEAIAHRAKSLVGGFSSTVFRFADGQAYLEAFTPTTAEADEILASTFPRPVADFAPFRLTQSGEVTQIPDIETLTNEIKDIGRARGFRSMLFAPLMNRGVSIGFIAVTRVQTGAFDEQHVQLLRTFADQAVIAIENARLFGEVQAKTRDLEEALTYQTGAGNILKVIASSPTDIGPVLKAIVTSACALCDADDALVMLKEGDELVFQAQHGPIAVVWRRQPIGRDGVAGRAIIDRTSIHVHDLLGSDGDAFPRSQEFARKTGVRTVLGVPLLREGRGVGVIVLRRKEVHPFSNKQIALLQTFADQAVIAIGNVHLFEQLQARTGELARSLDELRAAQDRLVQTEKLASLGQLTAGIAHEIKNPLNFVNNFAALSAELIDELNEALKSAEISEEIRGEVDELTGLLKDNLHKVVQHGKRADSIVKNMLLHSREGSGEHRPTDINALVEESLNLAYHGARAEKPQFNVTIEHELDPTAGIVEVFPQEITRVLLNLISNGFYAVVKRKAENGAGDFEPAVSARTRGQDGHVEIRIRDNGTGIPPDVREKMFTPFFTTKPAGEGTGLGLSMSHDIIVKQHGGTIEVESVPGEFTEFTIRLPRKSNFSDKTRGSS